MSILLTQCLLLVRFNEFGEDGGPAAKEWAPKLALVKKHIDKIIGKNNYHIDVKYSMSLIIFYFL